jgi:hypothetical protein
MFPPLGTNSEIQTLLYTGVEDDLIRSHGAEYGILKVWKFRSVCLKAKSSEHFK